MHIFSVLSLVFCGFSFFLLLNYIGCPRDADGLLLKASALASSGFLLAGIGSVGHGEAFGSISQTSLYPLPLPKPCHANPTHRVRIF